MSDQQTYADALTGSVPNEISGNTQAGMAFDQQQAMADAKNDFQQKSREAHGADDVEMRKNARLHNVDVGDDNTVFIPSEEDRKRLTSMIQDASESERKRTLDKAASVAAGAAQQAAGVDMGETPSAASGVGADSSKTSDKNAANNAPRPAEVKALEVPTNLEKELSRVATAPGRQEKFIMAGDPVVRQTVMDMLAARGKVAYRNGQATVLVSRKEFLNTFNEANRAVHGTDAVHALRLETNRTGGLKDAIGNALGRKSSLDVLVGGSQESIRTTLGELDKVNQKLTTNGVLGKDTPQNLDQISDKAFREHSLGSPEGVQKKGALLSANVDMDLRAALQEVKTAVRQYEQQEIEMQAKAKEAKKVRDAGGDPSAGETSTAASASAAARPAYAYASPEKSAYPESGPVAQSLNDGFSSKAHMEQYLKVPAGSLVQSEARSVLQRATNMPFGGDKDFGKLNDKDRAEAVTRLAATVQLARDGLVSINVDGNRKTVGSEQVSLGERVGAMAAIELGTNPQFREVSTKYLDDLVKDQILPKEIADKVKNSFAHQEGVAAKISESNGSLTLATVLADSKKASHDAAQSFFAAPEPSSAAGKAISANLAKEAAAAAAAEATATAANAPANTAATAPEQGTETAAAKGSNSAEALTPEATEKLEQSKDLRDAISKISTEAQPSEADVRTALRAIEDFRNFQLTDLEPRTGPAATELVAGIDKVVESAKAGEHGDGLKELAFQLEDSVKDWKEQDKDRVASESAAAAAAPEASPSADSNKAADSENQAPTTAIEKAAESTEPAQAQGDLFAGGQSPAGTSDRVDQPAELAAGEKPSSSTPQENDSVVTSEAKPAADLSVQSSASTTAEAATSTEKVAESATVEKATEPATQVPLVDAKQEAGQDVTPPVAPGAGDLAKDTQAAAATVAEQASGTRTEPASALGAETSMPAVSEPKPIDAAEQVRIGKTEAAAGELFRAMEHAPRTFTNNDKTWNEENIRAAVDSAARIDPSALKTMSDQKVMEAAVFSSWLANRGQSGELPGLSDEKSQANLAKIQDNILKIMTDRGDVQVPQATLDKVAKGNAMIDAMEAMAKSRATPGSSQVQSDDSLSSPVGGSKRQLAEAFAKDTVAMVYGKGEMTPEQILSTIRFASQLTPDRMKGLSQDEKAQTVTALKAITDTVREGGLDDRTSSNPKIQKLLREAEGVVGQLVAAFSKEPGIMPAFEKANAMLDAKNAGLDPATANNGPEAKSSDTAQVHARSADTPDKVGTGPDKSSAPASPATSAKAPSAELDRDR